MEEVQELADVPVFLNVQDQALAGFSLVDGRHTGDQIEYLVQLVQLAWRQLWDTPTVVKPVRYVPVFREVSLD